MKLTETQRAKAQAELAKFRSENSKLYEELTSATRCRRCGRTLTDPESIKLGIGPECASKEDACVDLESKYA